MMGGANFPSVLWQPAYVGLGGNVGDSEAMIARAEGELARLPHTRLVGVSPRYRSRAFGPVPQGDFVNAVAALLTRLGPRDLLAHLRSIEIALGRQPAQVRWGPREIDLDLLIFGDVCSEESALRLPHPGIPERDFVLYPLRDIAACLHVPGLGTVGELAARVADRGIERIERA
jgi:2-amino-4-hydroxy-6-hydroxymethyldihydropteridine diphosphokinase